MSDPHLPAVPGVTRLTPMAHRGSSSVYRGYQERFDRWVAVKVITMEPGNQLGPDARRRFERECAVTGRMSSHPNVVGIFDCGILDDGQPYLVTEFCEGGSLADRLARTGPLPAADVADIAWKIAAALRDTHREGIIHRDVKPANILLRATGEPALADFGLSVRSSSDASRGLDAFSPAFAPPEVLAHGEQSAAGDVYSLGATLYTVLTGRPPVPTVAGEAPLAYLRRVVEEPIAPIDRAGVDPRLAETVHAMLARRPQDRPTAADVVTRMQAVRAAANDPAEGTGAASRASVEDTSWRRDLETETQLRPPKEPDRRRSRLRPSPRQLRWAGVVAAVVVAVAALAGVLVYGPSLAGLGPGRDDPTSPAARRPRARRRRPHRRRHRRTTRRHSRRSPRATARCKGPKVWRLPSPTAGRSPGPPPPTPSRRPTPTMTSGSSCSAARPSKPGLSWTGSRRWPSSCRITAR